MSRALVALTAVCFGACRHAGDASVDSNASDLPPADRSILKPDWGDEWYCFTGSSVEVPSFNPSSCRRPLEACELDRRIHLDDVRGSDIEISECEALGGRAACFTYVKVLDETKLYACRTSIAECEEDRDEKLGSPDYTRVSRCDGWE